MKKLDLEVGVDNSSGLLTLSDCDIESLSDLDNEETKDSARYSKPAIFSQNHEFSV